MLDAGLCLLSDLRQLPPAQRHGQQKDPSPPEGIDLHGKLGTAETPQAPYPALGPQRGGSFCSSVFTEWMQGDSRAEGRSPFILPT